MATSKARCASGAAAMCLTLTACASASVSRADRFEPTGPDEVLVTVHNNDARAAVIYAYWTGMKERIGVVSGTRVETLRMKWRNELVQLGYEFIGRRALPDPDHVDGFLSEPLEVYKGDHFDFVIQPKG